MYQRGSAHIHTLLGASGAHHGFLKVDLGCTRQMDTGMECVWRMCRAAQSRTRWERGSKSRLLRV